MSRLFSSLLLLICLLAGGAVWYASPAGLGLTNDSAAYLGGARSILAGTGYSDIWLDSDLEPITHYPPLFSLTLSGMGLLTGLDPYRAARALHILLFALNTGLMGLLGFQMSRSPIAGIGLALLFCTNGDLLRIHAQVLSEPLFIFFSLASFLTFSVAVERQSAPKTTLAKPKTENRTDYRTQNIGYWMLLTGFLTALAFLTRYSALALMATFLAAGFLLFEKSRLRTIAFFLAGVIPAAAAWFLRNSLVAESATNRVFQFNPIELSNIRIGLWNIAHFLLPAPVVPAAAEWLFTSEALTLLLTLFGSGLFVWLMSNAWKLLVPSSNSSLPQSPNPLVFTTALYVFGYLGAVLVSMSFFDASTKFQPRILSPLYVSWMVLLAAGLQRLMTLRKRTRFVVPLAVTLALFVFSLSALNFRYSLTELREMDGLGYASWRWRQAEVLAYLRDLPPEIAIYSNSPPAVYLVTGRASRVVPTPVNPVSGLPRAGYDQALAEMRAELLAARAVLILFDVSDIEDAFGEEIALQFEGLTLLLKAQGHVLYGLPEIK